MGYSEHHDDSNKQQITELIYKIYAVASSTNLSREVELDCVLCAYFNLLVDAFHLTPMQHRDFFNDALQKTSQMTQELLASYLRSRN